MGEGEIIPVEDVAKAQEAERLAREDQARIDAVVTKQNNLVLTWDQETQTCNLRFDASMFRRWEFIKALLDVAKAACDEALKASQFQQLQQQMRGEEVRQQLEITRRNLLRNQMENHQG